MTDSDGERSLGVISLGEIAPFDLGSIRVNPARREIRKGEFSREIEPRIMQVLVALAQSKGEVVSRNRLIDACWNGRIVGDDAINRCLVALRHLAREFSPSPFMIETIPRVGYTLHECAPDGGELANPTGRRSVKLAALFALIVAVLTGAYFWLNREAPTSGARSIAVLPFRNLSAGAPYFAEGISEEIRSQLSRDPQFQVAGEQSTVAFANTGDARKAAAAVGVDFVLEGSVRSEQGRVRVDAALVKTRDGLRLWSESYDGKLDDIFAIQQTIGSSVAGALRVKLRNGRGAAEVPVTSGRVYDRYLMARGLLRSSNPDLAPPAIAQLRLALKEDPSFAPAWSSLAQAMRLSRTTNDPEALIATLPRMRAAAKRALQLQPRLAEAHNVYGLLLDSGTDEARKHLRLAAALDPNNAEYQIGLGIAHRLAGQFDAELAAYRRACRLDPELRRCFRDQAVALAERGHRSEAERFAQQAATEPGQVEFFRGRIALMTGDISETVRLWNRLIGGQSQEMSAMAQSNLPTALMSTGLRNDPPESIWVKPYGTQNPIRRVWMSAAPSVQVWQSRNRNSLAAEVYRDLNIVAAKLMLNSGRNAELLATYDQPFGLLGISAGSRLRADQLTQLPIVALALRRGDREAEANRLIAQADILAARILRQSGRPFWFDADLAAIRAVEGRRAEALNLLQRARTQGWVHIGLTDLPDLNAEPAFAELRSEPRFKQIRNQLVAHFAKERREIEKLQIPSISS